MTPRVTALLAGVALALAVIFLFEFLFGRDSQLMIPVLISTYGIVGAILGFRFPDKGWRLGIWLVAFWLVLFVGNAFFVGAAVPWQLSRENKSLLEHAMIIVSAFAGVWLGSLVKRNLTKGSFKIR
ncbi:MAG TPA: hypothetical protein DC047_11820 [Blastocatellia bacterium]|nr:hypothetical protein [Blastocatellia bacterium]